MFRINKLMQIILSMLIFFIAYKIFVVKVFSQRWMTVDVSSPYLYIPFGSLFLFVGILILIDALKIKQKTPQYTKCPNCKEVFNYNELTNGKCKNCEDIDTIDLDEYFEKYPDELEEKKGD